MKRIVLIFAIAVLISAVLPAGVFAESVSAPSSPVPDTYFTAWDGASDRVWYTNPSHAGTAEDPYIISTERELAGLSDLVSEGVSFDGKYISLARDMYMNAVIPSIDRQDFELWIKWSNIHKWTPVGSAASPFKGTFDGGGHAIFGLYIDGEEEAGFFGYTQNASVRDLSISHSYIRSTSYAGAVVAYMFVNEGSSGVENCFSDAFIVADGNAKYVGGVIGFAYAYRGNITVKNCVNTGGVSLTSRYTYDIGTGGIIGYARSLHDYGFGAYFNMIDCENYGKVTSETSIHPEVGTGGIIGIAKARNTEFSVSSCRNRGEVTGTGYTGGIVGYMDSFSARSALYLTGCANVSTVTGKGFTGGLVGMMSSKLSALPNDPVAYIEKSFNSGVVVGAGSTGGIIGTVYSSDSRLALRDSFSSGRVWSTYSPDVELALRVIETSETYGGVSSVVGKIVIDSSDRSIVELSRLYTVAEYTERTDNGYYGYVFGNCYCGGNDSEISVGSVFYPKTGYQVIGRITSDQSSNISCRGLETAEYGKAESFNGFDFTNVWTFDDSAPVSSPVLIGNEYEKTVCNHYDCQWTVTKKATCTEDGMRVYACTLCGEVLSSETVVATGHTAGGWFVKTDATCTGDGERARYCIICGAEIEREAVPATGHKPSDWTVVTPPSCTDSGTEAVICTACSEILQTRQIPPTGHDYVSETVKEATYFEDGLIRSTCANCGAVEETVVPHLVCGHEQTETRVDREPTCAEEGHSVTVCLICGITLSEETTEKLPHAETETVTSVEPTCTGTGLIVTRCKECGEVLSSETVPATGHSIGDWTEVIPATCLEGGEDRKYCANCGETMLIRQTAALGHTAGEAVTAEEPTCTESGTAETRCIRCGKLMSTSTLPALGHIEGEPTVVEPTCSAEGRRDYPCERCGEILRTEIVPATGFHTPVYERIDPTCTEPGTERFVCSVCGEVISELSIKATGHTFATVIKDGVQVRRCVICGLVESVEESDTGTETDAPAETETQAPGTSSESAPSGGETSSSTMIIILIVIIAAFAVACIVIILRSAKKNRLDE